MDHSMNAVREHLDPVPLSVAPADADETLSVEGWERTLVHLAELAGLPCGDVAARRAAVLALKEQSEPMAQMETAATMLGLRLSPARMSIADAVWSADGLRPLVVWSPTERRWLVVRKFGALRARISTAEAPLELKTISRRALAKRLGLRNALDIAEFGILYATPFTPAEPGASDHAAGHGHHHGSNGHHGLHSLSPLKRYLAVLRPESREVFAIVSFSIVTAVLYLALPLAVSAFVSNLSFGNQSAPFIQALLFIGLALLAALGLSALIRALQVYTAEVVKRRLFVRLMGDLTHRLPRVTLSAFEGVSGPELVNRFLDIVTIQRATERILINGIPVVLGVVIGTVVLGLYHPTLFGFSLLLWIGIGFAVLSGRGALDASIRESRLKYETVGWLEELARSPTLFKGPGGFALAQQRSDQLARRYLDACKVYFRVLLRQICSLLLLEIFATAALLMVGGWLVLQQQLTLGQLVASELIVASIVYSISKLGSIFDSWYSGLAAIDKIGHLTDLATERTHGEVAAPASGGMRVECEDVHFSYPGGPAVLSGLRLELRAGECVALWGISGRGSSTTLNLLFGMAVPDAGFIRLDGLDLRSWDLARLRSQVALIRGTDIVTGTVAENIRLGRDDIGLDAITDALDRVGLLDDLLALPDGLDTRVISGGLPLSSRQRLRLLLARAIVLSPRLLLLDDILDGSDPSTLRELFAVLRDPRQSWTVLLATRDPAVAELCQRYSTIDGGGDPPGASASRPGEQAR
jgi:putative ABC transport system ATP-binding protein